MDFCTKILRVIDQILRLCRPVICAIKHNQRRCCDKNSVPLRLHGSNRHRCYDKRVLHLVVASPVDCLHVSEGCPLIPYGIRVNGIGPAFVRTPMNDPALADPHFVEWSTNRIPLHRMGQTEEMAGAAIYLASDTSSFVNGAILMLDGGFIAC
ncbi:MAG: SDR family oxidoreductase [Pseudomonadota bacterium]